jgi:hypothetical protein
MEYTQCEAVTFLFRLYSIVIPYEKALVKDIQYIWAQCYRAGNCSAVTNNELSPDCFIHDHNCSDEHYIKKDKSKPGCLIANLKETDHHYT